MDRPVAMTATQRSRLHRLIKRGVITAETPWDQQLKLITEYTRKPRQKTGGVPQNIRRRMKVLFGLTPTQLLQYSEERQKEVLFQCMTVKDRRFKANLPNEEAKPKSHGK